MEWSDYLWNILYSVLYGIIYYVHTIHDITECARDSIGRIGSDGIETRTRLADERARRGAARGERASRRRIAAETDRSDRISAVDRVTLL